MSTNPTHWWEVHRRTSMFTEAVVEECGRELGGRRNTREEISGSRGSKLTTISNHHQTIGLQHSTSNFQVNVPRKAGLNPDQIKACLSHPIPQTGGVLPIKGLLGLSSEFHPG